jgi:hypothetical protein
LPHRARSGDTIVKPVEKGHTNHVTKQIRLAIIIAICVVAISASTISDVLAKNSLIHREKGAEAELVRYFSTHSDNDIRGAMLAAMYGSGPADLPHHLSRFVLNATLVFYIQVNALWRFGCITASRRQPGAPQFMTKRGECKHYVR